MLFLVHLIREKEGNEGMDGGNKRRRRMEGGKEEGREDLFIFLIVVKHTHHKTPMFTFLLLLFAGLGPCMCWVGTLPLQPVAVFRGQRFLRSIFKRLHSQSPEFLHCMRLNLCSGNNAHCLLLLGPGSHRGLLPESARGRGRQAVLVFLLMTYFT